ncbi:MAG TPA: peptidoglycan-binding domain-containing protein [Bryobacteraceae bacterium]|nr:peptidoglycan-binding domain-containing protein [Bryobacteraceae bacterium]
MSKPVTSQTPRSKTAVSASASKKSGVKKAAKPAAVIRHSVQQQPTPERYKEIQQALADKGYFTGAVDGNWGPDSVDALKRFQHDQNLPEDGKIGSLALIALGLGPKHDAGAAVSPASAAALPSGIDKDIPQ